MIQSSHVYHMWMCHVCILSVVKVSGTGNMATSLERQEGSHRSTEFLAPRTQLVSDLTQMRGFAVPHTQVFPI